MNQELSVVALGTMNELMALDKDQEITIVYQGKQITVKRTR